MLEGLTEFDVADPAGDTVSFSLQFLVFTLLTLPGQCQFSLETPEKTSSCLSLPVTALTMPL